MPTYQGDDGLSDAERRAYQVWQHPLSLNELGAGEGEPVRGYLAHTKTPRPQDFDSALSPIVGSYGGAVSYARGTPAQLHPLSPAALARSLIPRLAGVQPRVVQTRRLSPVPSSSLTASQDHLPPLHALR